MSSPTGDSDAEPELDLSADATPLDEPPGVDQLDEAPQDATGDVIADRPVDLDPGEMDLGSPTDIGSDAPMDTGAELAFDLLTEPDIPPPDPLDIRPCEAGTCWATSIQPTYCGSDAVHENYSTGRYNVHTFSSVAFEGTVNQISLTRTGGVWQPAIIVHDSDGTALSDGLIGLQRPGLRVEIVFDGVTGDEANVLITTDTDRDISIFVTGWEVVDSGFVDFLPTDAKYHLHASIQCEDDRDLTAPPNTISGEQVVDEGTIEGITIGSGSTWGIAYRVDAMVSEHIGFRLDFSPSSADVDFELLGWDGREVVSMGLTSGGSGLRVIAAYDPFGNHTFWVRARGNTSTGDLQITRTPLHPGPCVTGCDQLIQLPVPVDPFRQGFDMAGSFIFREQFGRLELIMALLQAGYRVAEAGYGPFEVQDLSNWDGSQPCCHETHTGGFHVDTSVLNTAGDALWYNPGGNFGDEPIALLLAGLFESGPYETGTHAEIILDSGFHDDVRAGADALLERGEITAEIHALFAADLGLIYHYPSHAGHLHIRIDR